MDRSAMVEFRTLRHLHPLEGMLRDHYVHICFMFREVAYNKKRLLFLVSSECKTPVRIKTFRAHIAITQVIHGSIAYCIVS